LTQVLSQDILRRRHEANRARRERLFQCPVPFHAHELVPSFLACRLSASEKLLNNGGQLRKVIGDFFCVKWG
jgi:hypothetical protein